MTKKDFIRLAAFVQGMIEMKWITPRGIEHLADFCAASNPRFNRQLWLDYVAKKCGPSGGKVKLP